MNINRVVLTGNLTPTPSCGRCQRHIGGAPAAGGEHPAQERPDRRVEGEGQLLRRHRGGAQAENRAPYLAKGRPVAIDGRLEWREYDPGRPEAPGGRGDRRERAVPRRTRAERNASGRASGPTAAAPSDTGDFDTPCRQGRPATTTSRSERDGRER